MSKVACGALLRSVQQNNEVWRSVFALDRCQITILRTKSPRYLNGCSMPPAPLYEQPYCPKKCEPYSVYIVNELKAK